MKIALVHDFLTQEGGAEKVLLAIHEIYPEAPIYVLFYDKDKVQNNFKNKNIKTSFLQKFPFAKKKYQWYLSLMPSAIEHLNLKDFDIIISSCSAFSKGIITQPKTLHICYCHTPTRYLWTDTHEYIQNLNQNILIKKYLPFVLQKLRIWDRLAAERVDKFIANSKNVQNRIKKFYNRESIVIYPPVEVENFSISNKIENYYLTGGRLVSYKKFDLVIKAFNIIKKPLKIFGTGPELNKLKKISNKNIEFVGKVSQNELKILYNSAKAFIHPQIEDFGITAIESMASGRPVIGLKEGGLKETLIHNETGIFFQNQKIKDIIKAIRIFENQKFNPEKIRQHSLQFSKENFKKQLKQFIENEWQKFKNSN